PDIFFPAGQLAWLTAPVSQALFPVTVINVALLVMLLQRPDWQNYIQNVVWVGHDAAKSILQIL
ncbi:hypothetical protein KIF54_19940, partial [Chromobacterium subtsugae]|uniref:hypothetical protein n=1 Tax=Chromobacterium subtsugae TaxID=251747 RepID=UPI001C626065